MTDYDMETRLIEYLAKPDGTAEQLKFMQRDSRGELSEGMLLLAGSFGEIAQVFQLG